MRFYGNVHKLRLFFAATSLIFIFLIRHQLYVLTQVVHTYVEFPQQLLNIHDYPSPVISPYVVQGDVTPGRPVPKIIHQIWLKEDRGRWTEVGEEEEEFEQGKGLSKYDSARSTCQAMHPAWENKLWTNENSTSFVRDFYPDVFPHYVGYKQTIQRTNILRYLLLHYYGGVYLDLDIACLEPLDQLRTLPWLTPAAYPAGINNAFILAKPRHPFLTGLISKIPYYDLSWPLPYVENMLSTGCMFFIMEFVRSNKPENELYVLGKDGELEPHMLRGHVTTPLFEHAGASSWHAWDAAAILIIGNHWMVAGSGALLAIVILVVGLSRCIRQRRRSFDIEAPIPKMKIEGK